MSTVKAKLQTPLTLNQMMNLLTLKQPKLSTSNPTPNYQTKTIHKNHQGVNVNHQINSHTELTLNHKLQKDINSLLKSREKLIVSNEQPHNNFHENRQTEKQILKKCN